MVIWLTRVKHFIMSHKGLVRVLLFVKKIFVRFFMLLCSLKPIQKNKVVILNFYGRGYGDNPKAIAEILRTSELDIDLVWTAKREFIESIPDDIHFVEFKSLSFYKEMATAGVWINNCRMSAEIIKRKGQFYVQLWHGGVPLKKIERDTQKTLTKTYIEHSKYDSSIVDLITSGCEFFTNIVKNSFWYDGEILQCGTPRLDTMFSQSENSFCSVKKSAGLPENKKIILYVPTFRSDLRTDCYKIDFNKVLDKLNEVTGDEWVFAIRLHPNVADKADFIEYSDRLINVTSYPDLYELLPACDIVVSDYSSVMFEAGMIEKTVFLYATDIEEYKKDRELYFEMNELPFILVENNDEFIKAIGSFDKEAYIENLRCFNKKMNYFENGNASEVIAERIVRFINNG